jgi:hypothetical protein
MEICWRLPAAAAAIAADYLPSALMCLPEGPMFALGYQRISHVTWVRSVLPPKTDKQQTWRQVRIVPEATFLRHRGDAEVA